MFQSRSVLGWAAGVFFIGATIVFGQAAVTIPPIGTDTQNEGRGITITPEGNLYVAGLSGTANGFVWDAVNGTRVVDTTPPTSPSTLMMAASYRKVNGQTEIVLYGRSAGWPALWFSSDALTWTRLIYANYGTGATPVYPTANSMCADPNSDVVYDCFGDSKFNALYTQKAAGSPPAYVATDQKNIPTNPTIKNSIQGMSSTGWAVGRRKESTNISYQNYKIQWLGNGTGNAQFFNALNGDALGEAWSISGDGTRIFGYSPKPGGTLAVYPYMATHDPVTGTVSSVVELPIFADTSSTTLAYGASFDGRYGAGYSYRYAPAPNGANRAVIWDTAAMTITDLTDWATEHGVLGDFTVFQKAYSVAVDAAGNPVITGYGNITGGAVRAYVLTMNTEPVGACTTVVNGIRQCSITTQGNCQGVWHQGETCANYGPCGIPWADADYDGAVDQDDFGVFQDCFTGDGAFTLSTACKCLDRNKNNAVDSNDLIEFEKCATGPMVLFTPDLDPNCTPGNSQLP